MLVVVQHHYVLRSQLKADNRAIFLAPLVEPGSDQSNEYMLASNSRYELQEALGQRQLMEIPDHRKCRRAWWKVLGPSAPNGVLHNQYSNSSNKDECRTENQVWHHRCDVLWAVDKT